MVVLTWIYGQNKLVKFTLPLPWNDLNPGQRHSDMRQGSSKPIQQGKLKTIGCYFYDLVAFDENGHVSSPHFQAMRSDGSTMLPCGFVSF